MHQTFIHLKSIVFTLIYFTKQLEMYQSWDLTDKVMPLGSFLGDVMPSVF